MFDTGFLEIPLVVASKPDGTSVVLATVRENRSFVLKYSLEDDEDEDTTKWGIAVPTINKFLAANAKQSHGHRKQIQGVAQINPKQPVDPALESRVPRKELIVTMPPPEDELMTEHRVMRPLPRRPTQTHIHTPPRPSKRPRPDDTSDETPDFTYRFVEDVEPPIQHHRRHVSDVVPTRTAIRPTHSRQPSHGVLRNVPVAGQPYRSYALPAGVVVPHGSGHSRAHVRFTETSTSHDDMHEDMNYTGRAGYGYQDDIYGLDAVPGPSRRR